MIGRDETDADWPPAEVDPIRAAIGSLLEEILRHTRDGSKERARAMRHRVAGSRADR
jgi:hypothetical protein